MRTLRKLLFLLCWILLWSGLRDAAAQGRILRFVYCSDLHYGLEREFRGGRATSSEVSRAMLEAFPMLEKAVLPEDGGVLAGEAFGEADFVVCTGDIANRMQDGVQTAAESWTEFEQDWLGALDVPLYLVPGNHDISNAIGYPKGLDPRLDATAATEIYNRAMEPDTLRTAATFDYSRDKVHYVVDCGGLRLVFVGMWLDAGMRAWFDREVAADSLTPVFVFTHDPPNADTKHFTNPRGDHSINAADRFENLLADTARARSVEEDATGNWRDLEQFFSRRPMIKAYFHGDKNYCEFYTWTGVDGSIRLPVFRVDSPMKGEFSAGDEALLSFLVATVDMEARRLTVRECLWNTEGRTAVRWGSVCSISY